MPVRGIKISLLALPLFFSLFWSAQPAIQAVIAAYQFPEIHVTEEEYTDRAGFSVFISRQIQQHFRKYNIHIPLEDILLRPSQPSYQERLFLLLDRSYGQGKVYTWIPLVFRFPFAGHKVLEWCWIPKVKTERS